MIDQFLYVARQEAVQIQDTVDRELDGLVHLKQITKELHPRRWLLTCRIDIIIRKAKIPDAEVVADFNLRLALETEGLRLDPGCVRAGVAALLADERKGIYYLAEVDGIVAGQLMITYEWSDWRNGNLWWIQSVYVATEFRRKGVFRKLFRHLEKLAREQKEVRSLRLYMHEANAAARRSYEELGMRQTPYQVFELEFEESAPPGNA